MKYWEILLIEQRARGKSGLTIPFLIGSQGYLNFPDINEQTISELIVDISQSNSFETCLRYCMDTQALIFEIRQINNAVYFPKHNDVEQQNLSVAVSFDNLGNSLETIISELESQFQEPIDKVLFSAEPNVDERIAVWKEYNNEDISFIRNSFKKLKNYS